MAQLTSDQVKATLELTDKLYEVAEAFGLSDDFVQEWATSVQQDVVKNTEFTQEDLDNA